MTGADQPLPYARRPDDDTPLRTVDLPATPVRDRTIPATAWVEAPDELLRLGDDLPGAPRAEYKRRIGPWLLWRAGPARRADARYWVARVDADLLKETTNINEKAPWRVGGKTLVGDRVQVAKDYFGVVQMDRLDASRAVAMVEGKDGLALRTLQLP